ncbi:MAG TPA: hypothetical protein VNH84_08660, partial [Candidatus Saccharimonadales bacterium]|nr:hypothetical protein [Candidatus Saccharimonadales bacterium]
MKRLLMHFAFGLLVLLPRAHAALVLDEPFSYPDGPLTLVAEGLWVTHGGTSNQVDVSAGRVNLTQAESEDVNAELAGGPFRGPALYAGFTVNFSALPSGAGAYFAHFKDNTATGFRARVYAGTNGAGPGKWRAGVATGAGTAVFIPTDLDLGADYALVLRYDTAAPASTLWINPTGENSTRERAAAEDSATAVAIASFGLRQALAAGAGMGTLRLDQLRVGTAFLDVVQNFNPRLDPPAISAIPDQSVPANISTPAVPFVVRDDETAADNLLLHATSDNPGLVAVSGVAFGGGGSNRTVIVTPTPGRQGAARVTITVTDADGNTANGTFQVTVGVPILSAVPDQITPHDTAAGPIPFTVGDAEGDTLNIWGTSTNETLLPVAGLHFTGTGTARSVVLEPASGHTGLSRVTLFVSDGFNTVSNS